MKNTPTSADPIAKPTTPPATDRSPALKILGFTNYANVLGGQTIIGQVQNQGSEAVDNIRIVASIEDSNGAVVGTGNDLLLALVALPAGQTAPFQVMIPSLSGEGEKVHIQSQFDTVTPGGFELLVPAQGLTVEGDKLGSPQQYLGSKLAGRLKNTGATAATAMRVLATAFDANGELVDVGEGLVTLDPLAPGSAAPFEVMFTRQDVTIAKYTTIAFGIEK